KGNPHRTDLTGQAATTKQPLEPPHIEVVQNAENPASKRITWYSELRDLTVGPTEVSGRVTEELRQEGDKTPDATTKPKVVDFRSARMGLEDDNGELLKLLQ